MRHVSPSFPLLEDFSDFQPLMNLPIAHSFFPIDEAVFLSLIDCRSLQDDLSSALVELLDQQVAEIYLQTDPEELDPGCSTVLLLDQKIVAGQYVFPWPIVGERGWGRAWLRIFHHAYLSQWGAEQLETGHSFLELLGDGLFLEQAKNSTCFEWLYQENGLIHAGSSESFDELGEQLAAPLKLRYGMDLWELPRPFWTASAESTGARQWIIHPAGVCSWEQHQAPKAVGPLLPIGPAYHWWQKEKGYVICQGLKGLGPLYEMKSWEGKTCWPQLLRLLQHSSYEVQTGTIELLPFVILANRSSFFPQPPNTPIRIPA